MRHETWFCDRCGEDVAPGCAGELLRERADALFQIGFFSGRSAQVSPDLCQPCKWAILAFIDKLGVLQKALNLKVST